MQPIDSYALILLKANRPKLTPQQYKTLRGQILAGNAEGAMRGLKKLINANKKINDRMRGNAET